VPECLERFGNEKYTGGVLVGDNVGFHGGYGATSGSGGSHGNDGDSINEGSHRKSSITGDSPWGATVTSTAKVMGKVDNIAQRV
jgi:hypothetical protein